jgi:hypothetical protein
VFLDVNTVFLGHGNKSIRNMCARTTLTLAEQATNGQAPLRTARMCIERRRRAVFMPEKILDDSHRSAANNQLGRESMS